MRHRGVSSFAWLALASSACAHHTDLRGRDARAQAWAAEQQRAEESARLAPASSNPSWRPEPRSALPEQAPPPRAPSSQPTPAPAFRGGAASRDSAPTASSTAQTSERVGVGTCFAIDAHGTLVTAQHVIRSARAIAVRLADGSIVDARVLRASESTDVALLAIEHATPDYLALGDVGAARVGASVFTVGYPDPSLLGTEPKFSDGSISSLSGMGGDAADFQMTVPVQPGNSGGPVVDERGQVVGVVVARAADEAFYRRNGALPQNVNFASKIENVRTLLPARPSSGRSPVKREAAIDLALRAVCLVLTLE